MIEKILNQEFNKIENYFFLSSNDNFSQTTQTFSTKWDYVVNIDKQSFNQ